MSETELTELRAAILQMIKADERRIDAEKRIIAMLDKRLGLRPVSPSVIPNASIAGAVGPTATT